MPVRSEPKVLESAVHAPHGIEMGKSAPRNHREGHLQRAGESLPELSTGLRVSQHVPR